MLSPPGCVLVCLIVVLRTVSFAAQVHPQEILAGFEVSAILTANSVAFSKGHHIWVQVQAGFLLLGQNDLVCDRGCEIEFEDEVSFWKH